MASVGGIACNFVRGDAPPLAEICGVWRVPGLDGYGAQVTGKGDGEFRFLAVKFTTEDPVNMKPLMNAWATLLLAMQGTLITIINDWGDSYTGCLVVKMGTPKIIAIRGQNGETARGEIEIRGVLT